MVRSMPFFLVGMIGIVVLAGCGQSDQPAKAKSAGGKIPEGEAGDWKTHDFSKGEFSVAMPPGSTGPKERQEKNKIPEGVVETTTVSFVAADKTACSRT
ncbi:MAG: hypothetical protein K8T25_13865 [Planctomycetia bacterium]|nr:hypothetical protein [Planctomycetia bacterium]